MYFGIKAEKSQNDNFHLNQYPNYIELYFYYHQFLDF